MFRKTLFWLHLCCGVAAGLVILMMSVTGVILTYERQIMAWAERGYYEESDGRSRLSVAELLERGSNDQFQPTSISFHADQAGPVTLSAGRSGSRHLNPYTGEVYEPQAETLDSFFSAVTGWHRWFNADGESRATARAITGASNLAFLVLILTGMYLWLPSVMRWSTMRLRLWFHPNARKGAARDFNWHHVFGFWAAIPLAVLVATATVFYYPWANALVYQLAGEEVPQRGGPARPSGAPATQLDPVAAQTPDLDWLLDQAKEAASEQAGPWNTIAMTIPESATNRISFSVDQGNGGQPQKRHSLSLDTQTGELVEWAPFSSQSAGRQARSWVRFLHTGEALGIIGQTIAGLASFAGVLMVWTGLALSLRRFLKWQSRVRARREEVAREAI